MKNDFKNILVVKNRALGDSIIGLSTLQYLKEQYPQSKVHYLIPTWTTNLYKKVNIHADSIIGLSLNSFSDYKNLWKKLSTLDIDLVIELHQSGKTAKFFKIYSFIKKIPYKFHNHHKKSQNGIIDQGLPKPIIQRDLDGVYSNLSHKKYPNYLDYSPSIKMNSSHNKDISDQFIFGIVATRNTKKWPLSYFIELAKLIKTRMPSTKILIPISPSKEDQKAKDFLKENNISSNVTFVEAKLENLPDILSCSKLYIGNDTGIKHLSVALDIRTITFFGPESPLEWHPYDVKNHHYFFINDLECRTRKSHFCALSECDNHICLENISPKQVIEFIEKL